MSKDKEPKAPKIFVLDTSVLVHDPLCITKFEDNEVIILPVVLGELDGIKTQPSEAGASARKVHQSLKDLFNGNDPLEGVKLPNGGTLRMFVTNEKSKAYLTYGEEQHDHQILNAACVLTEAQPSREVVVVTKDINLFLKAKSLKLKAEDYLNDRTKPEADKDAGTLETENPKMLRELDKRDYVVTDFAGGPKPAVNEFVYITANERNRILVRHMGGGKLQKLTIGPEIILPNGRSVAPKNDEQRMFAELMMDESVPLITAAAKAGTGKTFIAIAYGLYLTLPMPGRPSRYDRVVITRPIVAVGDRDIGFLPGSAEEKMNPWLAGYHDNIAQLLRPVRQDDMDASRREKKRQKRIHRDFQKSPDQDLSKPVGPRIRPGDILINQGLLEIQPLSHVRGRTFIRSLIIVDEAQNITPHEAKTIVTRVGEGSKIVLLGDPAQIDAPYVDRRSNGLAYVRDRMRNRRIAGHVRLTEGLRSELAEEAANLL